MRKWVQKLAVCSIILSSLPYNIADASVVGEDNEITSGLIDSPIVAVNQEGTTNESDAEQTPIIEEAIVEEQPVVLESNQLTVEAIQENITEDPVEVSQDEKREFPTTRSTDQFKLLVTGGVDLGLDVEQSPSYHANEGLTVTMNGHVNPKYSGENIARLLKDDVVIVDYDGPKPNGYTFDARQHVNGDGEYRVQMEALKDFSNTNERSDNADLYFYVLTIKATAILEKLINPEATDFSFGNNREDQNSSITLSLTNTLTNETITGITIENLQNELDKLDTGDYSITNDSTVSRNTRPGVQISATDDATVYFKIEAGDVVVNHYVNGELIPFSTDNQSGKLGAEFITGALISDQLSILKPGYELDLTKSKPTVSGVYTKNVQTIDYYYKKKQTTITVQYLDEETLQPILGMNTEKIIGEFESDYTTEQKSAIGYEFVEVDPNGSPAIGFHGSENSIVTYIYKRVKTNLIVKHLDIKGQPISDVAANTTQTIGSYKEPYTAVQATIKGYRYVRLDIASVPETGLYDLKDKTVIFLYEKIPSKLVEKHILEDGTILVPTKEISGEYGDPYKTTEQEIEGYELAILPTNPIGNYAEIDTTVTYTYRKKETQVIVHHIAKDGTILTAPETISGKFSDPYITAQQEFEGYRLVAVPDNFKGTYTMKTPDVTYVYEKIPSTLVEEHISEDGTILIPTKKTPGEYGDEYATTEAVITGYELVTPPINSTGNYGEADTTVTYTYRKKDTQVIVHHVTKDGRILAEPETIPGKFSDPYMTAQKEFEGYRLIAIPDNAQGIYTMTTPAVKYVYEKIPSKLVEKHISEDGTILVPTKEIAGEYGDTYETKEAVIEGYELVTLPSNPTGNYGEEDTTVTYVYKKKATRVIVHHVDQAGNKLAEDTIIDGLFNDDYQTTKVAIPGYVYLLVKGDPQKGNHKEKTQEVTYVYGKIVPPTVDTVYEGATELTGTGTPGTQVIITFPDGTTVTADVGPDGKWTVKVPSNVHLKEGQINSAISFDKDTGFKSEKGNGNVLPLPKTPTPPVAKPTTKPVTPTKTTASAKTSLPKTGEVSTSMSIGVGAALLGIAVLNYLKRRKA